jgi:hypothetical protein
MPILPVAASRQASTHSNGHMHCNSHPEGPLLHQCSVLRTFLWFNFMEPNPPFDTVVWVEYFAESCDCS